MHVPFTPPSWIHAATAAVLVVLTLGPPTRADAAPPPSLTPPSPLPVGGPQTTGFWLSVELIGPRGAQLDAAASLVEAPLSDALPRGGAPPPGEYVGAVENLEQALRWVDAHALSEGGGPPGSPPSAGGELLDPFGVVLTSLVLSPRPPAPHPYPWPSAAVLSVPEDLSWQPASLASARAPLFAAPGSSLPPAGERYHVARSDDALWELGEREVCSAAGTCLRWSKLLLRREDRFFAGWLPSAHVIPDYAWVGGPQERRFALRPGHRAEGECSFVLLEQRMQQREAPLGLQAPCPGGQWPRAAVEVVGEQLLVLLDKQILLSRAIERVDDLLLPSPR